ncbi:MAG: metalloregulator ArsR/SmtB family transcription factor [Oscillospiraceae bacterium]|nr:metalloregulator ArsR/SmtB family transcription factor [Oscillospiraceae bacterium]
MDTWPLPHDHGNEGKTRQLRQQLSRSEDFSAVADVFRLLDDSSRLRIFWLLCHCEECVVNLSYMTDMSSPAVSHHLRQLREAGLIESRREGREVYYRAADTPVVRLLHGAIEKVMEISCPETEEGEHGHGAGKFTAEQVETVRRMHDELVAHPEWRLTIEELAHRYLMNPTTLKAVFKAVYGDSLAGHIKEHRMEKAAELLRRGDESIAAIAAAVGYDSPSRFSAAFRERYHMLPTEYLKHYR